MRRCSISLLIALLLLASARANDDSSSSPRPAILGRRIASFTLRDQWGRQRSLAGFDNNDLVVVAFLGTECPLAKLYGPRLGDLAAELQPRGVQFLAINSNSQDSLAEVAAFARIHRITFPVLKDPDSAIADRFRAVRTPEVFLLDRDRKVRYTGRIDDQYAIGIQRDAPRRRDLLIAVEELLAGKPVSIPVTESIGCHIGRPPKVAPHGNVTYSGEIEGILARRCVSCHRRGQIAPFPLTEYREVVGWAAMIREVVDEGRMPPWFANPKHGEFRNDARLSDDERKLLFTWIDNGCPPGPPVKVESLPPVDTSWRIPTPDQVFYIADHPYTVPAEGEIEYKYFEVDPEFEEDCFIQAVEVRPGNRAVVHHALVSIIRPGDTSFALGNCGVLVNYAPGMQSTVLPAGMAIPVPAGSKFLVQMHYTPNGSVQRDRTLIGMTFAAPDKVVRHVTGGGVANTEIRVPAGAVNHREVAEQVFGQDVALISLSPHMHLRGKAFRYEAIYPDGRSEVLLDVPRYDFNWQLRYIFKEPKPLPRGTTLRCQAWYDNSEENLANPDPGSGVEWGDQTWQEMLIGFYGVVVDRK